MKRIAFGLLLVLLLPTGNVSAQETSEVKPSSTHSMEAEPEGGWVCPPCGDAHDETVFDAAGACPICGMTLIPQDPSAESPLKVGILLFDGVQIIDYAAPYEVFGQADFDVFTVSETGEAITTTMGMVVTPTYGFATSPQPDLLLVPGGDVHAVQANERWLEWVREAADGADYVLSVCNGAFTLAHAGLLDGKVATTFYKLLGELEREFPAVQVVRDQRYTDNGKVMTAGGLSAGIDASIYLVSKIKGEVEARSLALHLEYPWSPDGNFVRGHLADRHLADLESALMAAGGLEGIKQRSSVGDSDQWQVEFTATTDRSLEQFVEMLTTAASKIPSWKRRSGVQSPEEVKWTLSTAQDGDWTVRLRVVANSTARELDGGIYLERLAGAAAMSK